MKTIKFKQYQAELVNGTKGKINVPMEEDLYRLINSRKFIEDAYSKMVVRSNAIVKFEYVGIHEKEVTE